MRKCNQTNQKQNKKKSNDHKESNLLSIFDSSYVHGEPLQLLARREHILEMEFTTPDYGI